MTSLILQTAARLLVPIQIVFSFYLLWRGHNDPGGGFVGGLVVAVALGLQAIAFSPQSARSLLRVQPSQLVGAGLLVAILSGSIGLLSSDSYLTGKWLEIDSPLNLALGTPFLFDVGVYLVVIGIGATILFSLMSETED